MLNHPLCQKCNKCKAEKSGKLKIDGTVSYCKLCRGCRHEKNGEKRHPYKTHHKYTRPWVAFKKNYCEDCPFVAVHSSQLEVDHIDGNRKNNDPINLRTLCANCHRLKTYLNKDYLPLNKRAA